MTQIDFYILENNLPLETMACRIAEKAWQQNHRVHIHTDSPAQSQKLDDMLWTFSDESFIPHEIGSHNEELVSISINHEAEPVCHDVLINLAEEVPVFFSRFERVSEIIDNNPQRKETGRERYRFYRDRGYELATHKVGQD
jgi:DNA polymerase-3 subunit chi